jgi:hypothetical protein
MVEAVYWLVFAVDVAFDVLLAAALSPLVLSSILAFSSFFELSPTYTALSSFCFSSCSIGAAAASFSARPASSDST